MPLAFQSRSHGTIAFGYFNIEVDFLLLQQLFFPAERFCDAVVALRREDTASLDAWRIDDPQRVGDLHGAIAGTHLHGFIGALYQRFPFPSDPLDFRQSPQGEQNNAWASEQIARYGEPVTIALRRNSRGMAIDEFLFDEPGFMQLIAYIARGGYPRWRDGVQPEHVKQMLAAIEGR